MKQLVVILLLFSAVQLKLSGQDMVLSGSIVELKGNVYDFYESEHLFQEVPLAYQIYQRANSSRKTSIFLRNVSLVSLGVGVLWFVFPRLAGPVLGYVFPSAGILALVTHFNYKSKFKKAVRFYNGNRDRQGLKGKSFGLSFGVTQNGLGFVLSF